MRDELRRLSTPYSQRTHATLQRSHALLEDRGGGIHDAGINIPQPLQVEQRRRVGRVFEYVGRGLVHRDRARAGFGIGLLTGMQGTSSEPETVVG